VTVDVDVSTLWSLLCGSENNDSGILRRIHPHPRIVEWRITRLQDAVRTYRRFRLRYRIGQHHKVRQHRVVEGVSWQYFQTRNEQEVVDEVQNPFSPHSFYSLETYLMMHLGNNIYEFMFKKIQDCTGCGVDTNYFYNLWKYILRVP